MAPVVQEIKPSECSAINANVPQNLLGSGRGVATLVLSYSWTLSVYKPEAVSKMVRLVLAAGSTSVSSEGC